MSAIPGVVAALAVMAAGVWLADRVGAAILAAQGVTGASPVSGVPAAIVLGLILRQCLPLPTALGPGLKLATTTILRLGIVLLGIRLSLGDVLALGLVGLPVVLAAIVTGLLFVTWCNRRLGLPPRLGALVAAGTSICGVTAIVSTAPAIRADEREVAYAVANVVAFGLFGMLVYPYAAHALFADATSAGLFLGTAVHDTSQVIGAALTYSQLYQDDAVLRAATVTKLTRNLFLAVVVPVLAWTCGRGGDAAGAMSTAAAARSGDRPRTAAAATVIAWRRHVPGFVLGFVGMAIGRTIGDATLGTTGLAFGLLDGAAWRALTATVGDLLASTLCLGTAMAAVGLSTSVGVFRGVGFRPFAVGLAGALAVGTAGCVMARLLGPLVRL